MIGILIGFFTVVLILVSVFAVLLILMQKASANSGMGSALGGGAAESALGGEAGDVLSKVTQRTTVVFFVLAFGLYLAHMARHDSNAAVDLTMPTIEAAPAAAEGEGIEETAAADVSDVVDSAAAAATEAVEEAAEAVQAATEEAEAILEDTAATVEGEAAAAEETVEEAVEAVESAVPESTEVEVPAN